MSEKLTKITKVSEIENPVHKSGDMATYNQGEVNNKVSLPINYWVAGTILRPIEVGKSVQMLRKIRNGKELEGFFQTSNVQTWDGTYFTTYNSRYKVEDYISDVDSKK